MTGRRLAPWWSRDGRTGRNPDSAGPTPDPACPVQDLRLLAVDLETTGLNPARDDVVAVGLVPVNGRDIDLSGARHVVVRPEAGRGVGHSATLHGLTDDDLAARADLREVLPEVLAALEGRVLLAHHAVIEVGFLTRACRRLLGEAPSFTVVDTVHLHRRVLRRGRAHGAVRDGELHLAAARAHVGLPPYPPHDAMTDALGCAELYLAQVAHLAGEGSLVLRQLTDRVR